VRIAYVTDVHEHFEVVADALEQIGPVDALVVGGDLTTGGTVQEASQAVSAWQALAPRVLAVAGNMDSTAIDARLVELCVSIDRRGVVVDDVGFFGVSAAPRSPLRTPYELDEDELARRIETAYSPIASCSVRIFCPHAPPYDTACDRLASGQHVGSTSVRAFVDRAQPELVLCGHIHESRGTDRLGRSLVVNPGPASAGHYAVAETAPELSVRFD